MNKSLISNRFSEIWRMYPEIIGSSLASSFRLRVLQQQLLRLSVLNLFLIAVLGLILRSYSFTAIPLDYKNLLHGHSHFAFGGWVMPILIWMIMQYFPELVMKIPFPHWRNIVVMVLLSAYGMLLSFP